MPDERSLWNERYRNGILPLTQPNPFLADAYARFIEPRFPDEGLGSKPHTALDLAGGAGRHALWLAQRGWQVSLMDISGEGLALARKNAAHLSPPIDFLQADLREYRVSCQYDLVLVFYYLERSIFPELEKSLRPGGVLLYKTYVRDENDPSRPVRNPAHLLEPGELLQAFPRLRVLHHREYRSKRLVAELVATNS
jgi:SAM-dependent methyltransferase